MQFSLIVTLAITFHLTPTVIETKTPTMSSSEFPILPTTHGYIKGKRCTSRYDQEFYSFERIPYAKPPLDELRFRAPQPAEHWSDVLECFVADTKPVQRNSKTNVLEGSEDCLYLNVYVKQLQSDKPLPVLVYIYGGGFQTGGAVREKLGPDYFMHEDIVLVTINYRLGALGFLSLRDKSLGIPGNAGLKDQLAALKWLKDNYINFNGDPNNITLFGESAGGVSTHYLMLTPLAKGLFHKAIVMSGSLSFMKPGNYAYRLAAVNNYTGDPNDDIEIYNFLMQLTPAELTQNILTDEELYNNGQRYIFMPTIEAYVDETCILPKEPRELLADAWSNRIPLMIGGTTDEALLFYLHVKNDPNFIGVLRDHPEYLLPLEVRQVESAEKCLAMSKALITKYLGNQLDDERLIPYLSLLSVKYFWYFLYRNVLARLKYATNSSTFVYNFDFDSPTFNFYRLAHAGAGISGASHADDLCYLFDKKESWKLEPTTSEYLIIRRMVGMWTAFAATSNPNCAQISPAIWLPLQSKQQIQCMNINTQMAMTDLPYRELLTDWHKLYENLPI